MHKAGVFLFCLPLNFLCQDWTAPIQIDTNSLIKRYGSGTAVYWDQDEVSHGVGRKPRPNNHEWFNGYLTANASSWSAGFTGLGRHISIAYDMYAYMLSTQSYLPSRFQIFRPIMAIFNGTNRLDRGQFMNLCQFLLGSWLRTQA